MVVKYTWYELHRTYTAVKIAFSDLPSTQTAVNRYHTTCIVVKTEFLDLHCTETGQ